MISDLKKTKNYSADIVLERGLELNFELATRLVAMVTDAGVEHFGSLRVSVPYIWTELSHVLVGLTPTCVNKNLEKFLESVRAVAVCLPERVA